MNKNQIIQWLKCKVLLDIETKGQVFCIALGQVTFVYPLEQLDNCIYFTNIKFSFMAMHIKVIVNQVL